MVPILILINFPPYFSRDEVKNNSPIPKMLTATKPIPTKRVSPLKIVLRKLVRGSGVSVGVGIIEGEGRGVRVFVGDGLEVGVAVPPGVPVV